MKQQVEGVEVLINQTIGIEEIKFNLFTQVTNILIEFQEKNINKRIVDKIKTNIPDNYQVYYEKKPYCIEIKIWGGVIGFDDRFVIRIAEFKWGSTEKVKFSFDKFKTLNPWYFNGGYEKNLERLYNFKKNLTQALERRDAFMEILKEYIAFQESIPWFKEKTNIFPIIGRR